MHLLPLLMLAAAFWGQTPACGQPTITTTPLPVVAPGLEVVGLADLGSCSIVVDPTRLSVPGSSCMVVLHEVGHLLNYYDPTGFRWPDGRIDHSHSPDPNNVMYPVVRRPFWPCAW